MTHAPRIWNRLLVLWTLVFLPSLVSAGSFPCAAGDVGCLVASIAKANSNGHRQNSIHLAAGTYQPARVDNTSPEGPNAFPVITQPLHIVGAGAEQTLLVREDSAPLMRFFQVAATGSLTLDALTLRGGEVDRRFFQRGGCLLSVGEPIVVRDSIIEECAAWVGGAMDLRGTLILRRTIVQHNLSELVGAIALRGPVSQRVLVEDCWIGDNVAQSEAGIAVDPSAGNILIRRCTIKDNIGFLNEGGGLGGLGSLTLIDTVFLGNFGGVRGGAASFTAGTVTIERVTCLDNTAEHFGGCFDVQDAEVAITDSTIAENVAAPRFGGAGGGIYHGGEGRVSLTNTRVFANQAPEGPDCFGEVERDRRTFIGDLRGCTVIEAPSTESRR